jgi:hypothetical protein
VSARVPRAILEAAAAAYDAALAEGALSATDAARVVLEAVMPRIEDRARRQAAREVLALDDAERKLSRRGPRNAGPFGDAVTSLRRIARGEPLPAAADLHGGA